MYEIDQIYELKKRGALSIFWHIFNKCIFGQYDANVLNFELFFRLLLYI